MLLPMLPIALLALEAPAALAKASNPERIEIDLVFPKGKATYNDMIVPPIVFALQNAPTAAFFGYTIYWQLNAHQQPTLASGSFSSDDRQEQFNYTAGDVGILAASSHWDSFIDAGAYTLSWEYSTTTCSVKGNRALSETGNVRTGSVNFTTVGDGSGTRSLFSGCPQYLGAITAKDPSDSCPELVPGEDGTPDPCEAIMSEEQIACLESYFEGETDMDACSAGFDDIKPGDKVEWKYAKEARKAGRHAGSLMRSNDSVETNKSIGAVVRPGLWLLAAIVIAGTVVY